MTLHHRVLYRPTHDDCHVITRDTDSNLLAFAMISGSIDCLPTRSDIQIGITMNEDEIDKAKGATDG